MNPMLINNDYSPPPPPLPTQLLNVSQIIHLTTGRAVATHLEQTEGSEVYLSPVSDLNTQMHHWLLDYRTDGTFLIVSTSRNGLVITCEEATCLQQSIRLVMRRFTGEDNQLWRFDGSCIESSKFEGCVISCTSTSEGLSNLVLHLKEEGNEMQSFEHKVSS